MCDPIVRFFEQLALSGIAFSKFIHRFFEYRLFSRSPPCSTEGWPYDTP